MQIDLPKPEKRVVIKGYRTGIGIFFDDEGPLVDLLADLASSLERSNAFFTGAPVTLHVGGRDLGYRDFMAIRDLLVERHRLMIAQVHADLPSTCAAAERLGLKVSATAPREGISPAEAAPSGSGGRGAEVRLFPAPPAAVPAARPAHAVPDPGPASTTSAPAPAGLGVDGGPAADTLTVRQTLRSGQRIAFPGHVLVLGDVNSGAEVVADGDIVVFGALRGLAHAGAQGNTGAVVIALGIQPPQLRIGAVISRGSGGPARREGREATPEIARVEGETIVVETFRGRL